jgi:predicted O-methyltransferase YrrM
MLITLEKAFKDKKIETPSGDFVHLHSHTAKEQGLFLQKIIDIIRPIKSLEIGLAYGISTLFILEKHRELNNPAGSHVVIEPYPWGGVAEHNISKEELKNLIDIKYEKSDEVLPKLYYEGLKVQFAYIDTTKVFDTVLHDFYFIDKMLEVGGAVVFDDCNGSWPGVQRVARFVNTLPHYKVLASHNKSKITFKKKLAEKVANTIARLIPFKKHFFPTLDFSSDIKLGLDYSCLAFQKVSEDKRNWDWDKSF